MNLVLDGVINIRCGATYSLEEAMQAHIDLEARSTSGSIVFLPQ